MSPFVNENDKISVNVYFKEEENGIKVLENHEDGSNTIEFVFRRPNYSDSNFIYKQVQDFTTVKTAIIMQEVAFRRLLVDWSITDSEQNKIEINEPNVSKLYPHIARKASELFLSRIQL